MTDKIVAKNLYKIFGPDEHKSLELIKNGVDKDELFSRTGNTIGVRDASFTVTAGEIFVVMGLSGSGKSTLVRMLNRLIEPTSGQVFIDGKEVTAMSNRELVELRRRDMSMVFQSFALLPHQTVLENVAFGLEIAGMDKSERAERARHALEQVGLGAYGDSYADELSGGMQQRVGLARALATDPSILLMDEAFSALDPLIRTEMQNELLELQEQHERTVVFISHDLDEAMRIGDRIAIMEGGRILQIGTSRDILKEPADEYVQSFFRGVDIATVFNVGDICHRDELVVEMGEDGPSPQGVLEQLQHQGRAYAYACDAQSRYKGIVTEESLQAVLDGQGDRLEQAFVPDIKPLKAGVKLNNALSAVASQDFPLPVIGKHRKFLGSIDKTALLEALKKES